MKLRLLVLLLVLTMGVAACGGDEPAADDDEPRPMDATPLETGATDPAAEQEEVDTCALMSTDEAAKLLRGKVTQASGTPVGSLLGQCDYTSDKGPFLSIQARPAAEYEGTVEVSPGGERISDIGSEAYFAPEVGLLVRLEGEDYFLHVFGFTKPPDIDKDLSVEAGEIAAANV